MEVVKVSENENPSRVQLVARIIGMVGSLLMIGVGLAVLLAFMWFVIRL